MTRQLLFSLTKKDFEVQTFRAGGKGGQKQNKTESGVRIIHRESGAVGESREHRSQLQNRKAAFERLVASKKFQLWLKRKTAAVLIGEAELRRQVEEMMHPKNLRIEVGDGVTWREEKANG